MVKAPSPPAAEISAMLANDTSRRPLTRSARPPPKGKTMRLAKPLNEKRRPTWKGDPVNSNTSHPAAMWRDHIAKSLEIFAVRSRRKSRCTRARSVRDFGIRFDAAMDAANACLKSTTQRLSTSAAPGFFARYRSPSRRRGSG